MQLTTTAIITSALNILHEYGLGDLTIRRLARTLDVAPAALYWHFPNKQTLLGGVADELLSPLDDLKERLLKSVDDGEASQDSRLSGLSEPVSATTSQPPRPRIYSAPAFTDNASVVGTLQTSYPQHYQREW